MKNKIMLVVLGAFLLATCGGEAMAVTRTATESLPTASKMATLTSTKTPRPTETLTPSQAMPSTARPTATAITYVRQGTPVVKPGEAISAENAGQLVELARLGKGQIFDVQFTPDKDHIFVQTYLGLYVYETRTQDEVWRYEDPAGVASMAVDPAGFLVALGMLDGRVVVLDWRVGGVMTERQAHDLAVRGLAFSPGGIRIASGSDDQVAKVWEWKDNQSLFEIAIGKSEVDKLMFSSGGDILVIVHEDITRLINLTDEIEFTSFEVYNFTGRITFSEDGNLMTGPNYVWSIKDGKELFSLEIEHGDWGAMCTAFSPDDKYVAVGVAGDLYVEVFQVSNGEKVLELKSPDAHGEISQTGVLAAPALRSGPGPYVIWSVAFTPDGKTIAASTGFGHVEVWDFPSGDYLGRLQGMAGNLAYLEDRERLFSWNSGAIRQVNPETGSIIRSDIDFLAGRRLIFSPDSRWLFAGSIAWDIGTATRAFNFDGEIVETISANGDTFFTYDYDAHTVTERRLSDFGVEKNVTLVAGRELSGYAFSDIDGLSISPRGDYISAHVYDDGLYTWDLTQGSNASLNKNAPALFDGTALYSPNGKYAVFSYNSIGIYDVTEDFKQIGGYGEGWPFVFSPKGDLLLSGTQSEWTIFIVNADGTLDERNSWGRREEYIYDTAFSPDGRVLAVIKGHQEIVLIDAYSGEEIFRLQTHFDRLNEIAFSPDGRYLATSAWDGTIRLWGIAP